MFSKALSKGQVSDRELETSNGLCDCVGIVRVSCSVRSGADDAVGAALAFEAGEAADSKDIPFAVMEGGSTPTLENGWPRPTGWLTAICLGLTGDLGRDLGVFPSPRRTSVSIVRSRLPFSPFRIVELRFSSPKPMSLSVASFDSMFSPPPPTLAPKTLDCLLIRIGGGGG